MDPRQALTVGQSCSGATSNLGREQVGEAGPPRADILLDHSRLLSSESFGGGVKGQRTKQRDESCLLVLEGEEEGKRISSGLAGISLANPDRQLHLGWPQACVRLFLLIP